jgi:hypothetical protein
MDVSRTATDNEAGIEGLEHGYVAPAIRSLGTLQGVTGSGTRNELGPSSNPAKFL